MGNAAPPRPTSPLSSTSRTTPSGPSSNARCRGAPSAVRDVVVEARRIDDADPTQQHQTFVVALWHARRVGPRGSDRAVHRNADRIGVDERQRRFVRRVAGVDDQRRRRAFAQPEARARTPRAHRTGTGRDLARHAAARRRRRRRSPCTRGRCTRERPARGSARARTVRRTTRRRTRRPGRSTGGGRHSRGRPG